MSGTFHQGNIQSVTNPLLGEFAGTMGAVFSTFVLSPDRLSSHHIDEILHQGGLLFIADTLFYGNHTSQLGHFDIRRVIGIIKIF